MLLLILLVILVVLVSVGEVIGGEIVAMLDAMTQGNDGSLSTIHARSAAMVVHRISTYAMTSAQRLPLEASHLLTAGALDFVVHVAKRRLPDGRVHRHVASIREIVGYDGLQVVSSEVFSAAPGAVAGHAVPTASITSRTCKASSPLARCGRFARIACAQSASPIDR